MFERCVEGSKVVDKNGARSHSFYQGPVKINVLLAIVRPNSHQIAFVTCPYVLYQPATVPNRVIRRSSAFLNALTGNTEKRRHPSDWSYSTFLWRSMFHHLPVPLGSDCTPSFERRNISLWSLQVLRADRFKSVLGCSKITTAAHA